MAYLVYKMVFMLLSAAGLGAAFAWWWHRRHYEDVTVDHSRWVANWDQWRQRFETQLAARPAVDLAPLQERLTELAARIDAIRIPEPVATDLSPVTQQLAGVSAAVAAIRIPAPTPATDLSPVQARLDALEAALKGLPAPPVTDLAPLHARMDDLAARIDAIRIPAPVATDLSPVHLELAELANAVGAIRVPEPVQPDLGPLAWRMDALERSVAAIVIPAPAAPVDLSSPLEPVSARLAALEDAVREWLARPVAAPQPIVVAAPLPAPQQPSPAPALAPETVRAGSRNLLTHAAHGAPDDLQRIKGVAQVLERMLHGIGVYYFWQIAEWTPEDVAHADAQLTAFKGRIQRDHWVDQAQRFAAEPGAAPRP